MKEEEKIGQGSVILGTVTEQPRRHIFWAVFYFIAVFIFISLVFCGSVFGYTKKYAGKVYPGVYLGDYPLGGMDEESIRVFIDGINDRLNKEGIVYIYNDAGAEKRFQIDTTIRESDAVIELVSLGHDSIEKVAFDAGRSGTNAWRKYIDPLLLRMKNSRIFLPVNIQKDKFIEIIKSELSSMEKIPQNAGIKITSRDPLKYEVIKERAGEVFNYDKIVVDTAMRLSALNLEPQIIAKEIVTPKTESKYLEGLEEKITKVLGYGDIILTYADPETAETKTGRISSEDIGASLAPQVDDAGNVWLALDDEKARKFLDNYKYVLDKPAEESKFVMENGKVQEFRSGSVGQALNIDKTLTAINGLMQGRNNGSASASATISLIVDSAEPKIKMADVNNLGITSVIGSGFSTFYDSHTNRIKNIAHAVARLNGTIIAPGEVFSSIRYAGPFTSENGYLPEEVIKGNQIKKEIGGGMCQIGTTLFRMAMNSGMPITERTNHSLVVGYYADPVNGNPGTDATLYEPILDFKFLNDTGSYLLLETIIDYKKQRLTFTLWGKPDGRSGSFTHPLVSKWIPAGVPQETYTTTLKPGEKICQNAFRGAVASFTYTRFTSTTEKIERVFSSYYRPLPKICMVGVDPAACPDLTNCAPMASSTVSSSPTPVASSTASTTP
ncbi:MAG: VanW family protein [Candidatus Magasanikbacteria bacterium]|nr:VanW family protein [Candidatus Magasanikbacteria bacterium]